MHVKINDEYGTIIALHNSTFSKDNFIVSTSKSHCSVGMRFFIVFSNGNTKYCSQYETENVRDAAYDKLVSEIKDNGLLINLA